MDDYLAFRTALDWLYLALGMVGLWLGWKVFSTAKKWLIRLVVIVAWVGIVTIYFVMR